MLVGGEAGGHYSDPFQDAVVQGASGRVQHGGRGVTGHAHWTAAQSKHAKEGCVIGVGLVLLVSVHLCVCIEHEQAVHGQRLF